MSMASNTSLRRHFQMMAVRKAQCDINKVPNKLAPACTCAEGMQFSRPFFSLDRRDINRGPRHIFGKGTCYMRKKLIRKAENLTM